MVLAYILSNDKKSFISNLAPDPMVISGHNFSTWFLDG